MSGEFELFTITNLNSAVSKLSSKQAAAFNIEHISASYSGTLQLELKILQQSIDASTDLSELIYARSWLEELWVRADALSIALSDRKKGQNAKKILKISGSLIATVADIIEEIKSGNILTAEQLRQSIAETQISGS